MNVRVIVVAGIIFCTNSVTLKKTPSTKEDTQNKNVTFNKNETKLNIAEILHIANITKTDPEPKRISPELVRKWAEKLSNKLIENENRVVRKIDLRSQFSDVKVQERSGSAIVQKMVKDLEELLVQRARAAENIARRAEELAETMPDPPKDYTFDRSVELNKLKKREKCLNSGWTLPNSCRSINKVSLESSRHFDGHVSLNVSSVYVAAEVFDCDPAVKKHLYLSEGLLPTFKENYAQDATMEFQYFCSAKGFLRHYPAALWSSMYKLEIDAGDVYDCRLRPWYVSASGAPRDVLILLDASGSMDNSSNTVIAKMFTLALLSALTDDDQVNVLRFNLTVESPISCFNETLVPANHVNMAAMIAAMKNYEYYNETNLELVLTYAVQMLKKQRRLPDRPPPCQQAVVLVIDSIYRNYTELMQKLDPDGDIRLFVMWLHDRNGLRDYTRDYGDSISCNRDGYFSELATASDVTEQVMRILRVLERPLVAQRKQRLRVFSDVYAHVEDPRRMEYHWKIKEGAEQAYRYSQLRLNKTKLLDRGNLLKYYMDHINLNKSGHYYEGEDINYRLQISVSVPVFESTTVENITKKLAEEKQRDSTRTYPVNRLLGVAGVDIPIDHLKLILPYYQVGPGGTLFLLDHRGNIVLHDNLKPVFDGDTLKPGYRTMDFSDIEQAGPIHKPRNYPKEWKELRKALVISQPKGSRTILAKNVFEGGMRARVEYREYHWKRVLDHYTAVVVLPAHYSRRRPTLDTTFSQKLASAAADALSRTEYAVNQEWLYCRHVEQSFTTREDEVRHFIMRRRDEPYFRMKKTDYYFSRLNIRAGRLDKTYQCNEELMAWLCKDAIATLKWAEHHEKLEMHSNCSACELGPVTAFIATESGLTRWQQYHATSSHAGPPDGLAWPGGPTENWYRRAAASPGLLIVHAPVTPMRRLLQTFTSVPPIGVRSEWLTAARTLESDKGVTVGVAGYHFHPRHFADVLKLITNFSCPKDKEDTCEPRCDGEFWVCVVIDEGGWMVAGDEQYRRQSTAEPARRHLAAAYPAVMEALLDAKVFHINWIHDYQGVCFEDAASSLMLSSLLKTLWCSTLFRMSKEIGAICTLISTSSLILADTKVERDKRRKHIWTATQREQYETLYDDRVIINRTTFAACDRSRPMYEIQNMSQAIETLMRPVEPCRWPLVGAPIPGTNLLLLAIYKKCNKPTKLVPDPIVNEQVDMEKLSKSMKIKSNVSWSELQQASRLACWRNIEPLPGRPPHTLCFRHNYTQNRYMPRMLREAIEIRKHPNLNREDGWQVPPAWDPVLKIIKSQTQRSNPKCLDTEKGYRQCGPWLPDPEPENPEPETAPAICSSHCTSPTVFTLFSSIIITFSKFLFILY